MGSHKNASEPPNGGFGWLVVTAAFINIFLMASCVLVFAILLVEFITVFNVGMTQLSLLGNLQLGFSFMFNVFSGAFVTKFGCRKIALAGSIVTTIGMFTSAFANSMLVLYFTYGIITGIGLSLNLTASIIVVQQYFTTKRAMAAGISICGLSIAGLVTAPLGRIAIDMLGWRGTMIIHAGIVLNTMVFGCAYRPLPIFTYKNSETVKVEKISPCLKIFNGLFDCTLWKNKQFTLYVVANFLIHFSILVFPAHLVNFGVRRGLTRQQASLFPTYVGISSLISRILFSVISNYPCVNRLLEYGIFNILLGIVVAIVFLFHGHIWLIIYNIILGLANGAIVVLTTTVLADIVGVHRIGHAHGMMSVFLGASALISSAVIGFILDETHLYDIAFGVMGGVQVLGGIIVILVMCAHNPSEDKKIPPGLDTQRSIECMEIMSNV